MTKIIIMLLIIIIFKNFQKKDLAFIFFNSLFPLFIIKIQKNPNLHPNFKTDLLIFIFNFIKLINFAIMDFMENYF